jgi:hypothetical protein
LNLVFTGADSTNVGNNTGGGINIAFELPGATSVGNCATGMWVNLFGIQLIQTRPPRRTVAHAARAAIWRPPIPDGDGFGDAHNIESGLNGQRWPRASHAEGFPRGVKGRSLA